MYLCTDMNGSVCIQLQEIFDEILNMLLNCKNYKYRNVEPLSFSHNIYLCNDKMEWHFFIIILL